MSADPQTKIYSFDELVDEIAGLFRAGKWSEADALIEVKADALAGAGRNGAEHFVFQGEVVNPACFDMTAKDAGDYLRIKAFEQNGWLDADGNLLVEGTDE